MASLDRPRESPEGDTPRRTSDEAMSRLNVLSNAAANAHRMPTEVSTSDGGQNYYVRLDRKPQAPARVFCGTRPGDRDRLWFYGDGGEWIAEASDITTTLMWLKTKHTEAEQHRQAEDNPDDQPDDEDETAENEPLVTT
ncbi:hypothetical protein [Actinomadura sp. NEAU-AAG7]|uniref:hypothetical protein n=1 Tax=Actinomadura sp. NEAU-AAG7 TaxID=2839640 RepID=UPI001BE4B61D|nr:hypothetical protein [Actinomadura sp. NEAU-AAG7]MBT2210328.1 hypothetical protein [Actinomadura sp. NEAU-AAG7]